MVQEMSSERKLLLATSNPGKVAELSRMVADLRLEVVGLNAFPDVSEVPENGTTFSENAALKATGYAQQTGLPALADDSGLEVLALGGRPGVHSARYGGDVPFSEKMRMLLTELDKIGSANRSARFVSAIAFASPDGIVVGEAEGECTGRIADRPLGSGGFGYDPIFIPDRHEATFGELPDAVKARISHRSGAFSQILPILARFFGVLT